LSDGSPRVKPVRYGVIPAGGLGTRFLPISRTVPKELLPIIDTPVIEMVVAEMAAAGNGVWRWSSARTTSTS